jgi:ADP-dependent phosphofructokinase/glucokinase
MNSSDIKRINDMIKKHREAVSKQDEAYNKTIKHRILTIPTGAGLQSDDLSKVSDIDVIGKIDLTEGLKK